MENPPSASNILHFQILSSWQPLPGAQGTFSIRILNPRERPRRTELPTSPAKAHLDVEMADDGSAAAHGAAIHQVKEFFQKTRPTARCIVVSCPMGISRSTALALGLMFLESRDEQAALEHLFALQPQALPNLEVLTAWDAVLGCRLTREYLRRYSRQSGKTGTRWKNPSGSGRIPGCPTPHPASAATPT